MKPDDEDKFVQVLLHYLYLGTYCEHEKVNANNIMSRMLKRSDVRGLAGYCGSAAFLAKAAE
jgi:hypothetical protein